MLLVDSTVSAGHGLCLSRRCLTTSEQESQLPNKTWPSPLLLAGPWEKLLPADLVWAVGQSQQRLGWSLSSGSAGSPAPLMRQVQGWVWSQLAGTAPLCCKGSSPRAEQVFGRKLCWDFLRAQAMRAWVRCIRAVAWLCRRGAVFTFSRSAFFEGTAKSAVQFCFIPGQFNLVCETSKDTANRTITN